MWEGLSLALAAPREVSKRVSQAYRGSAAHRMMLSPLLAAHAPFKHHPWCLSSLCRSTSLWELLARQWDFSYMGSYIQLRSNHPGTEKTAHSDSAVFILQIN